MKVIFYGEKKYNFDGPDGGKQYWHDVRKINCLKRQLNGGSIMTYGFFPFNCVWSFEVSFWKSELKGISKKFSDHISAVEILLKEEKWI